MSASERMACNRRRRRRRSPGAVHGGGGRITRRRGLIFLVSTTRRRQGAGERGKQVRAAESFRLCPNPTFNRGFRPEFITIHRRLLVPRRRRAAVRESQVSPTHLRRQPRLLSTACCVIDLFIAFHAAYVYVRTYARTGTYVLERIAPSPR
jgi:hypothetical protein